MAGSALASPFFSHDAASPSVPGVSNNDVLAPVDARAGDVFRAARVDEDADADLVRFMIELASLLVELQLVARPTAPASRNHEAQRVALVPIVRQQLFDLRCGRLRKRHDAHRSNLLRDACLGLFPDLLP
jgi:hypothetical protein